MHWAIWVINPVLAGLIGWFTNWLAIKMLFKPRSPISILGFNFQGVIPKRRGEIAETIGKTIENELLTKGDLLNAIKNVDLREPLRPLLTIKIDELVQQKLATINPMLMAFIPKETLENIKKMILEEVISAVPEITEKLGGHLTAGLPISELVVKNISQFDLDRLEKMIVEASHKEFKFIEYLGGVVGILIGLIQTILSELVF